MDSRRTHGYCLGTARSGTTSMGRLFSGHYRSASDAGARQFQQLLLDKWDRVISDGDYRAAVIKKKKELGLEFDSSNFNIYILEELLSEFPQAKFILTIRDCLSFVDSITNFFLFDFGGRTETELRFRAGRYRHGSPIHPEEEAVLRERSLPTLDQFFGYWAWHNRRAIELVPKDRLLIVKTREISTKLEEISDFLGIPRGTLQREESSANRETKRADLLARIERKHVASVARRRCGELMAQYFPEVDLG